MKPVGFGLAALTAAAASFYATSRYSSESLVSAPATATGKRDEEYWNSRWAKTIKMGERWDVGRTEIMLQDMLDSGEIKPKLADAKVLVPGVSYFPNIFIPVFISTKLAHRIYS